MTSNSIFQHNNGEQVLVECFNCHYTWFKCGMTGSVSTSAPNECPICSSWDCKEYPENERGIDINEIIGSSDNE